jgi:hypothetical protein
MNNKKNNLTQEEDNLITKWLNKEITNKEFLKHNKKKKIKKEKVYEIKCECESNYLSCRHCQKRIDNEGYSLQDLYGDDYKENESHIMQSNYDKWYC